MHWENVELTSRSCVFRCETLCFCSTLFFALKFCNCGCTSLWLETSTCVCRGSQMKSLLHQLLSVVLHLEYIAKHLKERAHLIGICSIVLERYTILLLDHWNPIQFTFIDVGGQDPEFQMRTPLDQFPVTFSVAGDLGQTGWTKSTLDHIDQCKYDVHLLPGDLSYADYIQHRWDTFGELVEPLASARPWMVTEGNHEKESIRLLVDGFQSYHARWKMSFEESGSSSNLYCSFEVAGAHIIMLSSYTDYDENSDQYNWLKKRLNNGRLDLCGIVHITIGNGGNREGLARKYAPTSDNLNFLQLILDRKLSEFKVVQWSCVNRPFPFISLLSLINKLDLQQLAGTKIHSERSVFREASFGHGELKLVDSSHAYWTWHRNDDDEPVRSDEVWITSLVSSGCVEEKRHQLRKIKIGPILVHLFLSPREIAEEEKKTEGTCMHKEEEEDKNTYTKTHFLFLIFDWPNEVIFSHFGTKGRTKT